MIATEVKYKKTGIDWMPEIPEHWDIVRLKNVSKIVNGATPKSSVAANWDGNINWITPAEFGNEMYIGESIRKITKTGLQSCAASLVPIDSIILSSRAPIGSLGIANVELCTNQGCRSIVPANVDNYFLYFLLTIQKDNLNVLGNGTTFRELGTNSLKNYKIPLPPKEEQVQIATFLLQEYHKITRFIQAKQRLIELLKEQRQSIITQAVTKGIDENVKMKETVLGEIPQHWEVRRLKNICRFKYGDSLSSKDRFDNGDFDVYGSNGIVGKHKIGITKAPCIIIGRKGSFGKINFSESPCFPIDTTYYVDSDSTNANLEWLRFLLESLRLDRYSKDSAVPGLARDDAYVYRAPYPPTIEEQIRIIEHIKTETRSLDITISKAEREIELIKEYREAMIAEAVTGKSEL